MRKLHIVLLVLIAVLGVMLMPTLAQNGISDGCADMGGSFSIDGATFTGDFFAGESITFEVSGGIFTPGGTDTYTITIDGVDVATDYDQLEFTYTFAVDATAVSISVTITSGNFSVSVGCDDAGGDDDIPFVDGTLCHRPPGNPAAAHTITVGGPGAVRAHLAHGDSLGACPPELNTRTDHISAGLVFFIIIDDPNDDIEDVTEVISILGLCEFGECSSIVNITIQQVFVLIGTLNVEGFVEFDANDNDGYTIRIYYLGNQDRDGNGESEEVFQINVYFNGVLTNDDVLIIFADDGSVSWTLNDELGVDISILFSTGGDDEGDDDSDETCDADGPDDIAGTEDDEVCDADTDGDGEA